MKTLLRVILAKILETSVDNVNALAASIGLPSAATISPEMRTRSYIALIRRNCHLLPYDQLLELLEMTPERLAFALREDDFLWVKLGSLKPKCEPLHYHPPDEAVQQRAAEIRRVVEEDFGEEIRHPTSRNVDGYNPLSKTEVYKQINKTQRCEIAYKSPIRGCPTLKGWGLPKRSWITATGSRPMQWYIVA